MKINQIKSTTIRVESYGMLDELIDTFPCFTREGVSEVIIEVDLLESDQFKKLLNVVEATEETLMPDFGYVHFYK